MSDHDNPERKRVTPGLLERATATYNRVGASRLILHAIEDDVVRDFALALGSFIRQAGESSKGDYLSALVRKCKRYLFALRAVPVPHNHGAIVPEDLDDLLRRISQQIAEIYPELDSGFVRLHDSVARCMESSASPLLDGIMELLEGQLRWKHSAILLADRRTRMTVLEVLSDRIDIRYGKVDLVPCGTKPTPGSSRKTFVEVGYVRELDPDSVPHAIVMIGKSDWYPKSLRYSPRAGQTHIVAHSWLGDNPEPRPLLPRKHSRRGERPRMVRATGWSPPVDDRLTPVDLDMIEPRTDWENLQMQGRRHARQLTDGEGQDVEARLCVLEDQHAVFLDSDGSSTVTIVHQGDEGHPVHARMEIRNLELGMFILLRTEGGGEIITPLANHLLGDAARRYLEMQKEWKRKLLERTQNESVSRVLSRLRAAGAERASRVNFWNWVSPRTIQPGSEADFDAILTVSGLADREGEIKAAMQKIDSAHRKAGHVIRKALLSHVSELSMEEIEKRGRVDITLGESAGGKLTAFRLLEISPELSTVPVFLLNSPFEWSE